MSEDLEAVRCALAATRLTLAKAEAERDQLREALPDDLRAAGWMVAVHNDYRQDGESRTFWLLDDGKGRCVKGEGRTDAAALKLIRDALAPDTEKEGA